MKKDKAQTSLDTYYFFCIFANTWKVFSDMRYIYMIYVCLGAIHSFYGVGKLTKFLY